MNVTLIITDVITHVTGKTTKRLSSVLKCANTVYNHIILTAQMPSVVSIAGNV